MFTVFGFFFLIVLRNLTVLRFCLMTLCRDDCNVCFWKPIYISFESSNCKSNNPVMLLGEGMWKEQFFYMFLNGMFWTVDKFVEEISKQNSWLKIILVMTANHRTDRVNGDLYWKGSKEKMCSWTVFLQAIIITYERFAY